ncbi:MAG: porin, partial [Aurantimonas coralicida]|nr:porin [Aurantimonas coralicida]
NDANYRMDMGFIQLGGLTMGYLDSLWTEGDGLLTDTDLPVGDYQTNRISYTYAANGFTAALSLEDDGTGDFAPDVVGRLAYAGGWGSIYLAGSYDEQVQGGLLTLASFTPGSGFRVTDLAGTVAANPATFVSGIDPREDDGSFALKAGLSLTDLIAADSELKIEGSYAFDPSSYSTIGLFSNAATLGTQIDLLTGTLPVEWQIGAGYAQQFGKLGIAVAGVYGETFDTYSYTSAAAFSNRGNGEYYKLVGNVGYEITNNFDMLAEISYADIDFDGQNGAVDNSIDQTAGFLRFVRSF